MQAPAAHFAAIGGGVAGKRHRCRSEPNRRAASRISPPIATAKPPTQAIVIASLPVWGSCPVEMVIVAESLARLVSRSVPGGAWVSLLDTEPVLVIGLVIRTSTVIRWLSPGRNDGSSHSSWRGSGVGRNVIGMQVPDTRVRSVPAGNCTKYECLGAPPDPAKAWDTPGPRFLTPTVICTVEPTLPLTEAPIAMRSYSSTGDGDTLGDGDALGDVVVAGCAALGDDDGSAWAAGADRSVIATAAMPAANRNRMFGVVSSARMGITIVYAIAKRARRPVSCRRRGSFGAPGDGR